jgi:hypothetical protein
MFTPNFFKFFKALAKNNNREWFNEHKSDYQHQVVVPMCDFIEAMAPRLLKISPHFVANPRAHNGSMFRIYRDVRFSKDKSPYKQHAACQFRHELDKDAHTVGSERVKHSQSIGLDSNKTELNPQNPNLCGAFGCDDEENPFDKKYKNNPDVHNREIAFTKIFKEVILKCRRNELELYKLLANDDSFKKAMQQSLQRVVG